MHFCIFKTNLMVTNFEANLIVTHLSALIFYPFTEAGYNVKVEFNLVFQARELNVGISHLHFTSKEKPAEITCGLKFISKSHFCHDRITNSVQGCFLILKLIDKVISDMSHKQPIKNQGHY